MIRKILEAINDFQQEHRRDAQLVRISRASLQELMKLPAVEVDSIFGDGTHEWLRKLDNQPGSWCGLMGNIGHISVELVSTMEEDLLVL